MKRRIHCPWVFDSANTKAIAFTLVAVVALARNSPAEAVTLNKDDVARETQTIRTALKTLYERSAEDRNSYPLIALLQKMAGTSDLNARKYALMMEAERLALENRLFGIALRSAEERAAIFDTPIWDDRQRIVDAIADSPSLDHTEQAILLADYFLRLALSREDFSVATAFRDQLSSLVDEYVKREKGREEDLRKSYSQVVQLLKRDPRLKVSSSWDLVNRTFPYRRKSLHTAMLQEATLELNEAEARATPQQAKTDRASGKSGEVPAGSRLCFDRYSWTEGLPKLASGDGPFAKAAKKELAAGSTPSDSERIAIADEWWALSEDLMKQPQPNLSDVASIQTHASELYSQSITKDGDPLIGLVCKQRIQATEPPRILIDVSRAAANATSPDEAIRSYEMYLARPNLSESSRRAAEVQLLRWRLMSESKTMRHGDGWLPADLRLRAVNDANGRIVYGFKLLQDDKSDLAEAEFKAASKLDPSSPIPDSVLGSLARWRSSGLLYKILLATEYYREASRRDPSNGLVLTNLANCELITGRHDEAAIHYELAVANLPDPLVANNIGWAVKNSSRIGLSSDGLRRFNDLYRRALLRLGIPATENDQLVFFLPGDMPRNEGAEDQSQQSNTTPKIIGGGSGTGFLVAPGYVVTNHHVIAGASDITVTDVTDPSKKHPATLVATAGGSGNDRDLALLRCDGVSQQGLPLAESAPPRGEDVMALGFPVPTVLGTELKATRGAVESSVNDDGLYYLGCTMVHGNSGGPVVDDRARVVGAAVMIKRPVQIGNTYSLAIGIEAIREFLEQHLPDDVKADIAARAAEIPTESLKWTEVDAKASKATVLIETIIRQGGEPAQKAQSSPQPESPAEEQPDATTRPDGDTNDANAGDTSSTSPGFEILIQST